MNCPSLPGQYKKPLCRKYLVLSGVAQRQQRHSSFYLNARMVVEVNVLADQNIAARRNVAAAKKKFARNRKDSGIFCKNPAKNMMSSGFHQPVEIPDYFERLENKMSKVAIVYWSGTGNTEAMANAVAEGAEHAGAAVSKYTPSDFSAAMINEFDAIAFGCPSMGAEQLEEEEFEPMFTACEGRLSGKPIALFGSYGWGDGEWMRSWEDTCRDAGAKLVCRSVICMEAPDDEAEANCRDLGAALA